MKLDQADQTATLEAKVLNLAGKDNRDAKQWVA